MDRKEFLRTLALTGVAFTVSSVKGMDILTQKLEGMASEPTAATTPDLVAIMGGEPAAMFKKGIEAMGGISRFVKKGMKVTVKPNIGWDKTPELGANTNPELVAEIVRQCLAAGAKEVTVFDHSCDDWRKCYPKSGIEAAAKKAGATVVPANLESQYTEIQLPKGKSLKKAKVHKAILESDVWINVPVLKHHGGANLTISMKNHMGIVWDRQAFHQGGLQQCIADICTLDKKAVLNVVDAYRIVKTNGPQGRSGSDVVLTKGLFLSPNIVAVDTAATNFFNQVRSMPIASVQHLANGERLSLGSTDLSKIEIERIKM